MSVGHRHPGLKVPDPALQRTHIDQALDALRQRVGDMIPAWVPYLAGYSNDWLHTQPETFIDERLPKAFRTRDGAKILYPQRYIMLHECVEKCLMDLLGMPYELAHTIATAAEKTAVEADGFNWRWYCMVLRPWITKVRKPPPDGTRAPANLDRRPYQQCHDMHLFGAHA